MNYFKEMLRLQDEFNKKVNEDWRAQSFDWVNALLLETAEQIDSLDWKWWKAGKDDFENFKVEVIDNWHFLMSLGQEKFSDNYLAEQFEKCWELAYLEENEDINFIEKSQLFSYFVLDYKFRNEDDSYLSSLVAIFEIMQSIGIISPKLLYKEKIIKNCLNSF